MFTTIYQRARVYWDTRFNDIHIPLAYHFTRRLLLHYPEANEDVVVPAILLHDNGWKKIPEENQLDAFGPNARRPDLNRLHEIEGVLIAEEILSNLAYDRILISEIVEIINGHDSRLEALSLNDRLVKDGDKLWRFTPVGLEIDHTRFNVNLEDYLDWLEPQIDKWLFTPEAKAMAEKLLLEVKTAVSRQK